jgi:hypothetical protein
VLLVVAFLAARALLRAIQKPLRKILRPDLEEEARALTQKPPG